MAKELMRYNLLFIFCLSISMVSANTENASVKEKISAEKVNLVLRQLGHELLTIHGDVTSRLHPVSKLSTNEYVLEVGNEFNYDTVPFLLDAAFQDFKINTDYYVAIKDCNTNEVILGYNRTAFENGKIPCIGREQWVQCNQIHLVLEGKKETPFNKLKLAIGFLVLTFLALILYAFRRRLDVRTQEKSQVEDSTIFKMGIVVFDHKNQKITVGEEQKALTFRESKLLHFFFQHPNQVLKRETLLSEVWGDEGVLVGRSLDVFISRLRKILMADSSIQIKSVHGVGYRLEVPV